MVLIINILSPDFWLVKKIEIMNSSLWLVEIDFYWNKEVNSDHKFRPIHRGGICLEQLHTWLDYNLDVLQLNLQHRMDDPQLSNRNLVSLKLYLKILDSDWSVVRVRVGEEGRLWFQLGSSTVSKGFDTFLKRFWLASHSELPHQVAGIVDGSLIVSHTQHFSIFFSKKKRILKARSHVADGKILSGKFMSDDINTAWA